MKWCAQAGSKMTHSFRACSAHQNVVLLVDAMYWDLTYKYLLKKIVYNPESNKCTMHRYESCPDTAILKEFLDQELNKHEDDEKLNYCQWSHCGSSIIDNLYRDLRRKQRDFDWCYWWFKKTFSNRKVKNYQFLIQDEI